MTLPQLVTAVLRELQRGHGAHTALLYGSHASGTAGPESDLDVAAFAPVDRPVRIARVEQGVYLDVFVYPETRLQEAHEEDLRLLGSTILMQRGSEAAGFLARLAELHEQGPAPLSPDEVSARKEWAHKMLKRLRRGDVEGNYRRVWLLQALLEDYFHVRARFYPGPKKALAWLQESDPPAFEHFTVALAPEARECDIAALVEKVVGAQG